MVSRLTANETQTAIFVTSCSGSANVALRRMSIPGRFLALTTTAVRTTTATPPPETRTITLDASTVITTMIPPAETETTTQEASTITTTFYPSTTSSSLSSSSSESIIEPEPELEPYFSISAGNMCPPGNSAIFSTPDSKDLLILPPSMAVGTTIYSSNPSVSFAPTSGGRMCVRVDRTGSQQCGFDVVEAPGLRANDWITITCPDPFPPSPDLSSVIPLVIQTSPSCPNLVVQIGCEPDNYCNSFVNQGLGNSVIRDLRYPILSPTARLRVKVFGSSMRFAQWSVSFSSGPARNYYQANTFWLEASVPTGASSIDLQAVCFYQGETPEPEPEPEPQPDITFRTRSDCDQDVNVFFSVPGSPQQFALDSGLTFESRASSASPSVTYTRTGPLCATVERTGQRYCGNNILEVGSLQDQDSIWVECPAPEPYLMGAIIQNYCALPILVGTPRERDLRTSTIFDSYSFNVYSDDPSLIITPLGGRRTCATGVHSGAVACGSDTFRSSSMTESDYIRIDCPYDNNDPPSLDWSRPIPLRVTSGASCQDVALQVGCEGSYCFGYAHLGGRRQDSGSYPMLSPTARLRIKSLRTGLERTSWAATFGGDLTFLTQTKNDWLVIPVPEDASLIELETACAPDPAPRTRFTVNTLNRCSQEPPVTQRVSWTAREGTSNPGATESFTLYSDDPSVEFVRQGSLCATNLRSGQQICEDTFVRLGDLQDQDTVELSCTAPGPDLMVNTYNDCNQAPSFSQSVPGVADNFEVTPGSTVRFGLFSANPSVTYTRAGDLCARLVRASERYCGVDILHINELQQNDEIRLECPTPEPDLSVSTLNSCNEDPGVMQNVPGIAQQVFIGPGATVSFRVFSANPIVIYTRAGPLCATILRTNKRYCDDDTSQIGELQDQDALRLDCPAPEPALTVQIANNCNQGSLVTLTIPEVVNEEPLEPDAFIHARMYSYLPSVMFARAGPLCVNLVRTGQRFCGTDNLQIDDLRDQDQLQLECPVPLTATVINNCDSKDPVLVDVPGRPELTIIPGGGGRYDLQVFADNPVATFTPLSRTDTCAFSSPRTAVSCGRDAFTLAGIIESDAIYVTCGFGTPATDMSSTIPLRVVAGGACPQVAVQIGCEGDPTIDYCYGFAFGPGAGDNSLSYPVLSPTARLRVKALVQNSELTAWRFGFGGALTSAIQTQTQWLDIAVPDGASTIELRTTCTAGIE